MFGKQARSSAGHVGDSAEDLQSLEVQLSGGASDEEREAFRQANKIGWRGVEEERRSKCARRGLQQHEGVDEVEEGAVEVRSWRGIPSKRSQTNHALQAKPWRGSCLAEGPELTLSGLSASHGVASRPPLIREVRHVNAPLFERTVK